MAEFSIAINKAKEQADKYSKYSILLSDYTNQIANISASVNHLGGSTERIRSVLQALSERVKDEAAVADDMGKKLIEILTLYETIEKEICGKSVNTMDEVSKTGGKTGEKTGETGDEKYVASDVKTVLDFLAGLAKNIGKYGKQSGVTLTSSILSYLGILCGTVGSDCKSGADVVSQILALYKSSEGVESGIYKYYEKKLHPYEAFKLDKKYGKMMTGLSIASSAAETVNEWIETYKIFSDSKSSLFDRAEQAIELFGSSLDLGGKVYVAKQAKTKILQIVSSVSGSGKAVNQILATEQTLKYTTTSAVTKKISNVNAFLAVSDVIVSTIAKGVKQYGKVTEDGKIDMGDVGSVSVHASLSGLNAVAGGLSLGIVRFDSEKVAAELENEVYEFSQGDSWAAQYIRDKDNNAALRFGVSVGVGAKIVGTKIVHGVVDKVKTVGSWVSAGYTAVANLF